jgi:type I restriction enzyme M protein
LQSETDRISQTLTQRIKELAERYAETLAEIESQTEAYEVLVKEHLAKIV